MNKGNILFRSIIEFHRNDYRSLPRKEKKKIGIKIVRTLRNNVYPYRFLKKNKGSDKWVEVGESEALIKTFNALNPNHVTNIRTEYIDYIRNMFDDKNEVDIQNKTYFDKLMEQDNGTKKYYYFG